MFMVQSDRGFFFLVIKKNFRNGPAQLFTDQSQQQSSEQSMSRAEPATSIY